MKSSILVVALLFSGMSAQAGEVLSNCKDSNFNGLKAGIHYSELKGRGRFTELFYVPNTPAPAVSDLAGLCASVEASYLRHNPSKKMYAVMTSKGDCDGGTTVGVVIDLDAHELNGHVNQDGIVAEVGDGEVVCIKN